jgi:hypothetical protein
VLHRSLARLRTLQGKGMPLVVGDLQVPFWILVPQLASVCEAGRDGGGRVDALSELVMRVVISKMPHPAGPSHLRLL